jgi:hypothetical protein
VGGQLGGAWAHRTKNVARTLAVETVSAAPMPAIRWGKRIDHRCPKKIDFSKVAVIVPPAMTR